MLFNRGVVDLNDLQTARALVDDQIATAMRNMEEAGRLFARVEDAAGMRTRSVRDINNAYRHGTQVVYENCAPEEIPWRAANPEEGAGLLIGVDEVQQNAQEETVNVLLEAPDRESVFEFEHGAHGLEHEWVGLSVVCFEHADEVAG